MNTQTPDPEPSAKEPMQLLYSKLAELYAAEASDLMTKAENSGDPARNCYFTASIIINHQAKATIKLVDWLRSRKEQP